MNGEIKKECLNVMERLANNIQEVKNATMELKISFESQKEDLSDLKEDFKALLKLLNQTTRNSEKIDYIEKQLISLRDNFNKVLYWVIFFSASTIFTLFMKYLEHLDKVIK